MPWEGPSKVSWECRAEKITSICIVLYVLSLLSHSLLFVLCPSLPPSPHPHPYPCPVRTEVETVDHPKATCGLWASEDHQHMWLPGLWCIFHAQML